MEGDDVKILIAFISTKAKATDPSSPEQVLSCLAHAYAVVEQLSSSIRRGREVLTPKGLAFEQALIRVGQLEGIDQSILAHACDIFELLSAFEQEVRASNWHMFGYRHLLDRCFSLDVVWDARNERQLLFGTVTIWHTQPSRFRELTRERNADGTAGPPRLRTTPLDAIRYYKDQPPAPYPERAIGISGHSARIHMSSNLIRHGGGQGVPSFSVALCPMLREAYPVFRIAVGKSTKMPEFTVDPENPYVGTELLLDHVNWLVEQAAAQQVNILVLPELAIPVLSHVAGVAPTPAGAGTAFRDARKHLVDFLFASAAGASPRPHPHGVIAGSFHTWREQDDDPVNQAVILDRTGTQFLIHNKRGQFRILPRDLAAAKHMFSPYPMETLAGQTIVEGIAFGTKVQFLDSAFATVALLICADAIEPNVTGCIETIKKLQPDILYIISMSPETAPFEVVAADLAKFGISTFFVNARSVAGNGQCLAFMQLAYNEPLGGPPTRIRWLTKRGDNGTRSTDKLERFDYYDSAKKNTWVEIPDGDEHRHAVRWLVRDGMKSALVIDLGAQWSLTPASGSKMPRVPNANNS